MKISILMRAAEILLPFLTKRIEDDDLESKVRSHEVFYYLRLMDSYKLCQLDCKHRRIIKAIIRNHTPAFLHTLEEKKSIILSKRYWEIFLKERQEVIPKDVIGCEFYHLEKGIFSALRDEIYKDKYELLYHVFSLYLLYLKSLMDYYVTS